MTWYLDTNVCVVFLRGTAPAVRQTLLSHSPTEVRVPAIVQAELLFGAQKSTLPTENVAAVNAFLSAFRIVPFDSAAAEHYGRVRAELERAGTPIGPNDLIVAATVLAEAGILVTHNTAEFARVPGLRCEDWQ